MRLIKNYLFKIGTKIPFSEWPKIVHQFLHENHLSSHHFLYYFEDILAYNQNKDEALLSCGCARIIKDCPSLGEIRYFKGKAYGLSNILYLSNIDQTNTFPEENILPLMKKIHRRYGFCDCNLYYFDIDFFGEKTKFDRDYSHALRMSESKHFAFDPSLYLASQPYGSGIALHRDVLGENTLKLSIDILHNGNIVDAEPYYRSMQSLLPKIKSSTSLSVYLTEEEQQKLRETDLKAEPILQQCHDFLSEQLPLTSPQNHYPSNYSVAKPLKKIAKKYGFLYKLIWNGGVYSLEKRTAKGNILYIDVESGPSHYNLGIGISYQGLGFKHILAGSNASPSNQEEADAYLENVFSVVSKFENTLLISLDDQFPETPDWFIPSEF